MMSHRELEFFDGDVVLIPTLDMFVESFGGSTGRGTSHTDIVETVAVDDISIAAQGFETVGKFDSSALVGEETRDDIEALLTLLGERSLNRGGIRSSSVIFSDSRGSGRGGRSPRLKAEFDNKSIEKIVEEIEVHQFGLDSNTSMGSLATFESIVESVMLIVVEADKADKREDVGVEQFIEAIA